MQFEFGGTLENSAQVALIDAFLSSASINPYSHAVTQMLEADRIFIVTSTLKSSALTVSAKDNQSHSMGLDVPVIQNAVGGNMKVTAATADGSVVTYQGAVPLVFGFQAVQLIFEDGRYRTMKLVEAGSRVAEAVTIGGGEDEERQSQESADPEAPLQLETSLML